MAQRVINNEFELESWVRFLRAQSLPMTVSKADGARRSNPQNRTIALWYSEIASQRGDCDFEDVRAECKLHFGVPIMRRDNPKFRAEYDEMIRPLPYPFKVRMMRLFQMPVTSLMTTKQCAEYQDAIWREYTGQGIVLTNPDELKARAA